MFKRREFDVEVEYFSGKKDEGIKRGRLYGRQISLPNGFIDSNSLSRKHRTKSTSDLRQKETEIKGSYSNTSSCLSKMLFCMCSIFKKCMYNFLLF